LKVVAHDSPFTSQIPEGKILRIPVAHGEGCYFADDALLNQLEAGRQILWRYCDARGETTEPSNPNGSLRNIAGICNEQRTVAGLMPHPERACEPILGSADGRFIFESMIHALAKPTSARAA
jgi:phosphoribosylformylglycinamidine synthase